MLGLLSGSGRLFAARAERNSEPDAPAELVLDFKEGSGSWRGGPRPDQFRVVSGASRDRAHSVGNLSLLHDYQANLTLKKRIDLSQFEALRFDVFVPKTHSHVHFAAYFVDEDAFWFQSWQPLIPVRDKWCTLELNLKADGAEIESRGHGRPWGAYVARGIREMGLFIFADRPTTAEVAVDRITFVPAHDTHCPRPPQQILNYETSTTKVPRHGKFEIAFELSRCYENPYDPDMIEIWGIFTSPSGKAIRVPGFFHQGYARTLDRKMERLIPTGAPKWKIRFAPREEGLYTYEVEVLDGERLKTDPATFECVPSDDPGCVQVCADDHHCFEFEDGSFFYPIGENLPATFNVKGARQLGLKVNQFEGTFAYDRFLEGMERGKANYTRIWLASWSFGLEWSRSYHPSYRGLGRYNQENAWRLDHVLQQAEERGVYVQLALTTFGHFRMASQFEGDWAASPYNIRNGGILSWPQQFWHSEKAQKIYQRMVRYVMARWGYSSHIAAWELSNEIDLVSGYPNKKKPNPRFKRGIIEWHKRCVETIRRFDPNPHLVTTNFAIWTNDPDLLTLPEVSFSSTNHYNVQIVKVMRKRVFPLKDSYGKPAIMAECGYDFKGAMPETTERYLHICLWASYMMPFAGNGLSWWWDFIDDRDLYYMFRPIAEFARGEDRRRRNLKMSDGSLHAPGGAAVAELAAITFQNDRSGYFWVYERRLLRAESDFDFTPEERKDLTLKLAGLKDGTYRIEFWDTRKGECIHELTAEAKDGSLPCPVPLFTADIAGKVNPVSEE